MGLRRIAEVAIIAATLMFVENEEVGEGAGGQSVRTSWRRGGRGRWEETKRRAVGDLHTPEHVRMPDRVRHAVILSRSRDAWHCTVQYKSRRLYSKLAIRPESPTSMPSCFSPRMPLTWTSSSLHPDPSRKRGVRSSLAPPKRSSQGHRVRTSLGSCG